MFLFYKTLILGSVFSDYLAFYGIMILLEGNSNTVKSSDT